MVRCRFRRRAEAPITGISRCREIEKAGIRLGGATHCPAGEGLLEERRREYADIINHHIAIGCDERFDRDRDRGIGGTFVVESRMEIKLSAGSDVKDQLRHGTPLITHPIPHVILDNDDRLGVTIGVIRARKVAAADIVYPASGGIKTIGNDTDPHAGALKPERSERFDLESMNGLILALPEVRGHLPLPQEAQLRQSSRERQRGERQLPAQCMFIDASLEPERFEVPGEAFSLFRHDWDRVHREETRAWCFA